MFSFNLLVTILMGIFEYGIEKDVESEFKKNLYRNIIFMQFYSDFSLAGTQFWPTCKDIFNQKSNVRQIISMFPIHASIFQVFYYLTFLSFSFIILWFFIIMVAICSMCLTSRKIEYESDYHWLRWHPLLILRNGISESLFFIK